MKNRRNYYRILHVQHDAPREVIRSSYRTLMQRMRMHPDLGGNHAEAALINEACAVLTNPAARTAYDARLAAGSSGTGFDAAADGTPGATAAKCPHRTDPASGSQCPFCLAACRPAALLVPEEQCRRCGSPLYPAQRQRMEACGQRAIARVPRRIATRFWTRWPQAVGRRGRTEDVSLAGIQLRTGQRLAPGQIIKLDAGVLDAIARVVDSHSVAGNGSALWRNGLEFMTLRIRRSSGTFVSIDV